MLCTGGFIFLKNKINNFDGNYLEIGIFDGNLISSLAGIFPNKKFYGIDPFIEDGYTEKLTNVQKGELIHWQKEIALINLSRHDNLSYYINTSENFYNNLSETDPDMLNISCILIDGSHWYKDVIIDTEISAQLIGNKKGFILFDDVDVPEVEQALNDFLEKYKHIVTKTSVILTVNNKPGLTVVYLNGGETNA